MVLLIEPRTQMTLICFPWDLLKVHGVKAMK